jgi:K+-dependent Na+/Ca+ exchanger related-protein
MALDIILFIVGAALVIFGADWLVDGASGIARRFGLSEFLIGATIVGIGTSMPELVVSTIAAIEGNADITIGNVTGSNMFNTLLILGITALLMPIGYTKSNIRRDVPMCIAASLLLMFFSMDAIIFKAAGNTISRWEGIVLLLGFVAFLWYSFKQDKGAAEDEAPVKKRSVFVNVLLVLLGFAGLIFGGDLFVDSATGIARELGVSDAIIAITIMAGGTSFPELATCVVAAAKKRGQMALGNILGSNISNILLIVGTGAVITPLNVGNVNFYSTVAVVISSLLVLMSAFSFKKMKLDRVEGVLFVLIYVAYIWAMLQL